MDWTVRESNPGGGEIFRTRTDRPWDPPSLLYNGYRVSFPGVKRPGRGVDHPPPSSVQVEGRVELYICSPSGTLWPVIGWPLPLRTIHRSNERPLWKQTSVTVNGHNAVYARVLSLFCLFLWQPPGSKLVLTLRHPHHKWRHVSGVT